MSVQSVLTRFWPALLLLAAPAQGAEDAGVTTVFTPGGGARALALGGAFVAISDDASAPLWNPGGLGFVDRIEVQATRSNLYLDMSLTYAGLVLPSWQYGVAALTFRHFGADRIEGRDDRNQVTNQNLSDDETELTLSYARSIGAAWSLGGTFRWYRQSLADLTGNSVGVDAGFLTYPGLVFGSAEPWGERFALGVSIRNLFGSSWTLVDNAVQENPTARLGLAYTHPWGQGRNILLALDLEKTRSRRTWVRTGLEAQIHPMLTLRSGINNVGFTVGAGIRWGDVSFDYTYQDNELGSQHGLGLTARFGPTTEQRRLDALAREEEALEAHLARVFDRRLAQGTAQLLDEARTALAERRYDDALERLAVIAALSPDNPGYRGLEIQTLLEKAKTAEERDELTDAAVLYGRVAHLDPLNEQAQNGVTRCQNELADRAMRSVELRRHFTGAMEAFTAGRLIEARHGFEAILDVDPSDNDARDMLRRTKRAVEGRVNDLIRQATRFAKRGLYTEALESVAEARQLSPDSGVVKEAEREITRAREEATAATARREPSPRGGSPKTPPPLSPERRREIETLYKQGIAAAEARRTHDAIRYWELVYSADPGYQKVGEYLKQEYLLQGMDAFAKGELEGAITYWEKALIIDPTDEKTKGYLVRARRQLARTREIMGDADE